MLLASPAVPQIQETWKVYVSTLLPNQYAQILIYCKSSSHGHQLWYSCDRKSRAACSQSVAPWQQATIEIMLAISLTIACLCYIYDGVILHTHPIRGESHN